MLNIQSLQISMCGVLVQKHAAPVSNTLLIVATKTLKTALGVTEHVLNKPVKQVILRTVLVTVM